MEDNEDKLDKFIDDIKDNVGIENRRDNVIEIMLVKKLEQSSEEKTSFILTDKFNELTFEKYLSILPFNNDLFYTKHFLQRINDLSVETKRDCLERVIEFMHSNQLYINYFDAGAIIEYVGNNRNIIRSKYVKMKNELDKTFLFSIFESESFDDEKLKEIYNLRKEIMLSFRKNRKVSESLINSLRDLTGRTSETDFYRVLKRTFIKLDSDEVAEGDIDYMSITAERIGEHIYSYPNDQSGIVLYLYVCCIFKIAPKIKDNKLEIVYCGQKKLIDLNLNEMLQNKLPYKHYYYAIVQYRYGDRDIAKEFFRKEKHVYYDDWDSVPLKYVKREKIKIHKVAVPDDVANKRLLKRVIAIVILLILYAIVQVYRDR